MINFRLKNKKLYLITFLLLTFLGNSIVFCTHNTSRYFPFLERPADYVLHNKSHVAPAFFITRASTADKRGGGEAGIPELWGKYDLNDVIDSLEKVCGDDFVNPIITERGEGDSWIDKSIRFKVEGKIKSRGFLVNYEQLLGWHNLSAGLFLPVMHVNTSDRFTFLPEDSDSALRNLRDGEFFQLDRILRQTNNSLGLRGGDWTKTGVGDLDLHASWKNSWDYKLLMKNIYLSLRAGTTIPTGTLSDINYASSVSFMGNGHWSLYFDVASEFVLKQDWTFGVILGFVHQFKNSRRLRIPVYEEPAIFSALKADVEIDPGMTFKFSPYIIAQNLTDGINFEARYTYLRHNKDTWKDKRCNPQVRSYLNQQVGAQFGDKTLTQEDICCNIAQKKDLSLWRAHYFTFMVTYDSKDAGNDWMLSPIIYASLDYNMNGNAFCKTYQFTLGVQLHF